MYVTPVLGNECTDDVANVTHRRGSLTPKLHSSKLLMSTTSMRIHRWPHCHCRL